MYEIEKLKKLIEITNQYTNKLLHDPTYKDVLDFINSWSDKLKDEFYTLKTKIFWVLNNIHEFPKCKICGKEIRNKNVFRLNQPQIYNYCSQGCMSKDPLVHQHYVDTMMRKYGKTNGFQVELFKQKSKDTLIKKYGVDHYSKCDMWNEQVKETSMKRYGVEFPNQAEEIQNKKRNTCNKKYGTDYPLQSEEIKQKSFKSRIRKYGKYNSDAAIEKRKFTNLEKYGKESYTQTEEYHRKSKITCLNKYGVENAGGTFESVSKARRRYFYNGVYFSSMPEIAYYIWLVDNKISFEYQPRSKRMKYQDCKGKWHTYYPDFWIKDTNEIHEIKGQHSFRDFNENNEMIWFRHPEKNYIAAAKHKCMIENGVKILTNKDYKKFIDYCNIKFCSCSWYKKYKMDKNKNEQ